MGIRLTGPTRNRSFHRLIAEDSPDLHTVTTIDGVYVYVSGASLATFGWAPDDLVGQPQQAFIHPDDLALVDSATWRALQDPYETVRSVCRFRCADGTYRWIEAASRLIDTPDQRVVVSSSRDVGDREKAHLELQRQATTDPLTGVANRTVFLDRFQQALRRLDRGSNPLAVLFLDLDRFKLINDSLGHHVGDAVLVEVAQRLRHFMRPQDTLARLGGDEFAILFEDIAWPGEAAALGKRTVEISRTPFAIAGRDLVCTTSVGIAVTADSHRAASDLLKEADVALYRAKQRGRDRFEIFDEELRTGAVPMAHRRGA